MRHDLISETINMVDKEIEQEKRDRKQIDKLKNCFNSVAEGKGSRYDFRVCFYHWYILELPEQMVLMDELKSKYPATYDIVNEKIGALEDCNNIRIHI